MRSDKLDPAPSSAYLLQAFMIKAKSTRFTTGLLVCLLALASLHSFPAIASEDEQLKVLITEYSAGKYDAAFKHCVAILRVNKANITAHYYMGNLYLKYHKLDEAAAEYKYCVSAGADTTEGQAAQQGLEAVEKHRAAPSPAAAAAVSQEPPPVDANVQAQIDRLKTEAEERIAVQKKILDVKLAGAEQDMRDQTPRYRSRLLQWSMADLEKEKQAKTDRFNKEFERDKQDINDACDKRVNDLLDTQKNIDRRKITGP